MEGGDLLELALLLLVLAFMGMRWLYRRVRASATAAPPPATSPTPGSLQPPLRLLARLRPLRPAAASAFVAVLVASILLASWAFAQPTMSPDASFTIAMLAATYLCIGGPIIAVVAALLTLAVNNAVAELLAKPLPAPVRAAIGALIGLGLAIPGFLLLFGS